MNDIGQSTTNSNAKEISERCTTREWSLLCEKCLTYVSNKMRHQHHKESHTNLISCFTGYLRTHLHRSNKKKGEISEVYTTLFELLFVKISSILGFKVIDNVVMIPAQPTSNMWILSRMCFGELVNDDSNPLILIDVKQCNQTKLGVKVLRFFEGHTGLNGYNSEQEILDKHHTGITPVQHITNIRQQYLQCFKNNNTKDIVRHINSLYMGRDGKKRDSMLPLLKFSLKLSLTEPSAFNSSIENDKIEFSGVRFFWRCCNEAHGSNWYFDDGEDNQSVASNTTFNSNRSNRAVFIENKKRYCIQLGYESLLKTDLLKVSINRRRNSRAIRLGKREVPRHTSFISRIFDHTSKVNLAKLYNNIKHYLALDDDLNFNTDYHDEDS